jgi:hypothetical protein
MNYYLLYKLLTKEYNSINKMDKYPITNDNLDIKYWKKLT